MGGGIFTYTALVTAAKMVQESDKGRGTSCCSPTRPTRRSRATTSGCSRRSEPLGITVSVIGLGSETDADAAFLKDVAARGKGRIHFTASADELPRLFAQEAITVARSSFVTEPTGGSCAARHGAARRLPPSPFPSLDGYNLTYLRPGATMGVVTTDEYRRPCWRSGIAGSAASRR